MPPHLHYVEPYFGGGAVLLARDPNRNWMATNGEKLPAHLKGCSEVVNDINGELMNFWRVLASETFFQKFNRTMQAVPFGKPYFDAAQQTHLQLKHSQINPFSDQDIPDPANMATRFFIFCRQSMAGRMECFAPLTRNRTRGGRNEQANAWLGCIEGLPEIHERLKGVVILNDDAVKVIKQQDGEHTLFYCDPPYLHETRSSTGEYGEHEMTETQHFDLLKALAHIKGKFMLSGYHSTMYDADAKRFGWNCHERVIDNKASSKKEKEKRIECLWCNFL